MLLLSITIGVVIGIAIGTIGGELDWHPLFSGLVSFCLTTFVVSLLVIGMENGPTSASNPGPPYLGERGRPVVWLEWSQVLPRHRPRACDLRLQPDDRPPLQVGPFSMPMVVPIARL